MAMMHDNNSHAIVNIGDDVGGGDGAAYTESIGDGDGRGDGWGYGYPIVGLSSGDGAGCGALDSCRCRLLDGNGVFEISDLARNSTPSGDGKGIGDYS